MSDHEDIPISDTGRIGFRDIYRAVNESEARITTRINEAFNALTADAADHEARLRIIEAAVLPLSVKAEARDRRIDHVETMSSAALAAIEHYRSRDSGIFATLGAGKQAIVVGAAIVGGVVSVFNLVSSFTA